MFLFINTVTLLNIYNLEVQTKNFTIIDCKTSSVFSYGFVRDFLPSEYKNKEKNLFKFENDDLSELFFYKIASDYLKLNENRIYMIESDKAITMCDFTISINENCKIIDINPKFSFGKVDDNYQKIEIKNIDNYSKFIWDYFLQNTINNNKTILIYNIKKILNKSINNLESIFMNYPLIYLYNSIEKIHNIFSILLDIIKNDTVVRFDTLNESLKIFCENENENMIMQRYHLLKGQEINAKSKDFFLSCLLTDIFNILNFFINNNSFIFTIFNFIEFKNILYGEFYIVSEINLDYDKVKRDNNNKTAIYLYDVDNNEINKFITIYCKNKILIILSKIWCLNNNLNSFKIIIHTYKEIYESKYLDIRKNIYD